MWEKIGKKIVDLMASKKGILGFIGLVLVTAGAYLIKPEVYAVYCGAVIAILTALGLGFQQDKKLEIKPPEIKQ